MKLNQICNAMAHIQANMEKDGDLEKAIKVAELMCKEAEVEMVINSIDEDTGEIGICYVWDNFQSNIIKELYKECKAAA